MTPPVPLPSPPEESADSARAQTCNAMIERGLAQPGVREVMMVYGDWERRDQALAPYRAAMQELITVTATDHANFDSASGPGKTHAYME